MPGRIGRYRVLELLGRGAMGVVYRGRDDVLEREVALKLMLLGEQAGVDAHARFLREARAAARLQHPNIVTVYELGEHEGSPFLAMELLEGMDLQRAIEGGLRPDPRRTLPIVLQLLAGLGHAHENGIVHRDVKPSNLFLPRRRAAKIMDFGVARLTGGTASGGATQAGVVVGTPNYMSPEQVRGGQLDGRSDLFSAGLILYELVTGERAYQADSVVALLYKIAHEPADLGLIPRAAAWERLRQVLARSLAQEPERRYRDARAMSADLVAALLDLGGRADWAGACDWGVISRAKPRSEPVPTPLAADAAAGPVAPPPQAALPARRAPLLAAGGLALAAGVLLVAAGIALRRAPGSGPPSPAAASRLSYRSAPSSATPAPTPSPLRAMAEPPPKPTPTPVSAPSMPAVPESAAPTPIAPDSTPDLADARAARASALLEQGRYSAALAEARAVLRRDPRDAEAATVAEEAEAALVVESSLDRAREALERGDSDSALEHLKIGLAVNSNDRRLLELWRRATQ